MSPLERVKIWLADESLHEDCGGAVDLDILFSLKLWLVGGYKKFLN